jgi:HEAT repeat protein
VAVAIIRIDPKDEEAFRTAAQEISKGEKPVRLYAIEHIADIPDEKERAVPLLIKALGDPDSDIRRNAVISLGRLGSVARIAAPVLKDMLKNNQEDSRVLEEVEKMLANLEKSKE